MWCTRTRENQQETPPPPPTTTTTSTEPTTVLPQNAGGTSIQRQRPALDDGDAW
jgi:hypothetical protein